MKGFKDDDEGICVQKSCLNLNVFSDSDKFSHTKKCTHCSSATNECTRCSDECALVNSEGNCGCAGEVYNAFKKACKIVRVRRMNLIIFEVFSVEKMRFFHAKINSLKSPQK